MSYKVRFIAALVVIILISWFDFRYLSMYPESFPIPESVRRVMHLGLLAGVMLTGAFAWAKCPVAWVKTLWWYAYLFALAFLVVMGLVEHYAHVFHYNTLYAFYEFRVFFCSPLPMFILFIFSRSKIVIAKDA